MARKKRQTDLEEAIDESVAQEQRKNSELTEDERRALHYRHCREYEVALKAKKDADAELKNVGKRIKAESDSVAKCKKTIAARTPAGEAALRAEVEENAEVLRWAGVSVGATAELFPEDRTPSDDRAEAEGKRAGLDGQSCNPPYDPSVPQHQAWIKGWHDGQGVLASAFEKVPTTPPTSDLPHVDTSDRPFAPGDDDEMRVPDDEAAAA